MRVFSKITLLIAVIFLSSNMLKAADNLKIVVLPFDKLNKEKNNELDTLVVGISETLSGALSTVNNFVVIDSNRVKRHLIESAEFKQTIGVETQDIENLRELTKNKLEGDFIIYGSFNKIGNNIQLSAKFMKVSSGIVTQGANVHGKYPDEIFALQEQLAKDLVNKITGGSGNTNSQQQQKRIEEYSQSTVNYNAYQYYIKGRVEHLKYDVKSYPAAIENYKKALKYDSKYALAWAGLAEVNAMWGYQIAYANGNPSSYYRDAIEQGRKGIEYGNNLYQTHLALSVAYQNQSDFDNANKEADKAYSLNPNDAQVLYQMASLRNYDFKDMGAKGTDSYNYVMRALALNPELIVARWALAHSYSTNGENNLALKEYKEVLNINPTHAPSLHSIALIYYDMEDYKNSIVYAIKTIKADPKTPQHHYTLGLSYFQDKNYKEAIPNFEYAVKLNPKYEDAMQMIGTSYWYLSKWDMAYKYYNKTLEINPNNQDARTWRDDSYEKMKKK